MQSRLFKQRQHLPHKSDHQHGMVRMGAAHYNALEEGERLREALMLLSRIAMLRVNSR